MTTKEQICRNCDRTESWHICKSYGLFCEDGKMFSPYDETKIDNKNKLKAQQKGEGEE
jgi:hypothetical protein